MAFRRRPGIGGSTSMATRARERLNEGVRQSLRTIGERLTTPIRLPTLPVRGFRQRSRNLNPQERYAYDFAGITPRSSAVNDRFLYQLNGLKRSYLDELRVLNHGLPPMDENCKLSVVIAAANEAKNIRRALDGWTTQQHKLDPREVELIVFANKPNSQVQWDTTVEEVNAFKRDNPQYAVHVVRKEFNFPEGTTAIKHGSESLSVPSGVKMGMIFKVASDLSLLRNLSRENGDKANHLLVTTAADVVARHPKFVRSILSTTKQDPSIDFIRFKHSFPPAIAKRVPLLWAFHQYRNTFADLFHAGSPRRHGAVKLAKYAEVNGFNPATKVAEEIELGKRLAQAGAKIQQHDFVGVLDNPRRSLHAILTSSPVVGEYSDFDEREAIEKLSADKLVQFPPHADLTPENLSREITSHVNAYIKKARKERKPGWYSEVMANL